MQNHAKEKKYKYKYLLCYFNGIVNYQLLRNATDKPNYLKVILNYSNFNIYFFSYIMGRLKTTYVGILISIVNLSVQIIKLARVIRVINIQYVQELNLDFSAINCLDNSLFV